MRANFASEIIFKVLKEKKSPMNLEFYTQQNYLQKKKKTWRGGKIKTFSDKQKEKKHHQPTYMTGNVKGISSSRKKMENVTKRKSGSYKGMKSPGDGKYVGKY